MKKALMSIQGYVNQVVEPGEDFEIYCGPDATIQWVDAPDDITIDWTLEWSPSANQMVWVKRDKVYVDPEIARKVGYGDVGAQLDMLYKDMVNGTTNWQDHIASVKASIPKPSVRPTPMTYEEMLEFAANEEPGTDKPMGLSTTDCPAWKRYPGWVGYQTPAIEV
jgi:hypothetical protein